MSIRSSSPSRTLSLPHRAPAPAGPAADSDQIAHARRVLTLSTGCSVALAERGVRLADYTYCGKALLVAPDRHGNVSADRWCMIPEDAPPAVVVGLVADLVARLDADDPPTLGLVR